MEDKHVDEAISRLSRDLLKLARELQYERWTDRDAQDWYIAGMHDSAHLMMLKWIKDEKDQDGTANDGEKS